MPLKDEEIMTLLTCHNCLCLVPDVVIPPKFKVLNFDKYKGTTCPRIT